MRLDATEAKNLLSHKDTRKQWLGDRINVTGDNGAGKTSFTVDTMLWTLFGNARGATTDDLKGPWSSGMEASVAFMLNGKDYIVRRERGSSSKLGLINVTDSVDMTEKHISMTQEKIVKLLGSENSFTNTVVFKQGDALRFAQMKPAERKGLIDELTGIEEMSGISKVATQRSKAAEAERVRLQLELDRLHNAGAEVAELEESLRIKNAEYESLVQQLRSIEGDSTLAEEMLASVQESHAQKTRLEGELRNAEIEYLRATTTLEQLETKATRVYEELEALSSGTECPTCGSELDPSHPHVKTKTESLTAQHEVLVTQISDQRAAVELKATALASAKGRATTVDAQITDKYEKATRLRESAKTSFQAVSARQSVTSNELAQMQGKLDVLRRDLPKIPQIEGELVEVKKRIKGFDLIAEAFSKRGIPRELTRSFVNEIEKGANALLVGLSPFTVRLSLEKDGVTKGGVTEGTMDVWVKDTLPERKVEMLSGGEKMRIMLAVRLATAQAMAKKHERAIKTLIIDEALDGLDTAGKDAALTMISSLTNFERCIFITHDPSVAGYFPEKVHFIKTADGSSAIL